MIPTAAWSDVNQGLPQEGRPLLACFDEDQVFVFAAHSEEIGRHAVAEGRFGGPGWAHDRIARFRLSLPRVMARSARGGRKGRERVLGIALKRSGFDSILRQAVHWRESPEELYGSKSQWRLATRYTQVVMDWAPDCGPGGEDLHRFTARFGVRAQCLKSFHDDWILQIVDLRELVLGWRGASNPPTPLIRPYPLAEPGLAERLQWEPDAHVQ